jgi:hypothetical protein
MDSPFPVKIGGAQLPSQATTFSAVFANKAPSRNFGIFFVVSILFGIEIASSASLHTCAKAVYAKAKLRLPELVVNIKAVRFWMAQHFHGISEIICVCTCRSQLGSIMGMPAIGHTSVAPCAGAWIETSIKLML